MAVSSRIRLIVSDVARRAQGAVFEGDSFMKAKQTDLRCVPSCSTKQRWPRRRIGQYRGCPKDLFGTFGKSTSGNRHWQLGVFFLFSYAEAQSHPLRHFKIFEGHNGKASATDAKNDSIWSLPLVQLSPRVSDMTSTSYPSRATDNRCSCCPCCTQVCSGRGGL
jgi:hypothetical protein